MSACTCEVCGKGPAQGVSVFRANAKGVPGIWRCRAHLSSEQAEKMPDETIRLVNIIDPPKAQ